jgi:hypothetical protein
MPIRITIVGGPLDGQKFEFGADKTSVTFGRFPDRDVRFPADQKAVSRAHFTIVQENHKYFLRPDEPVFVDGHEGLRDDALPMNAELTLGTKDGQKLRVAWWEPADLDTTEVQYERRPAEGAVREAMKAQAMAARGHRRTTLSLVAGGAAAVIAVVAVAVFFFQREEPLEAKLAALRPSVYLVMARQADGQERGFGTAWVVGPGLLASNAHVVEPVLQLPAGAKAFVRSNVPPYDTIEIKSVEMHPHYKAFPAYHARYFPMGARGQIGPTLAYDTGLIRVDPAAKLAPPLKIASQGTLEALSPGEVVAFIGYPMEGMAAEGVNVKAPNPQTQIARITAVTDFFLVAGPPATRHLVQHSLPATGGASGSPIFNAKGEVIAAFNAVNFIFLRQGEEIKRVANPVIVNFGQRADLVTELIEGRAAATTEARQKFWSERLSAFTSGAEYLIKNFERQAGVTDAKPVVDRKVTLKSEGGGLGGGPTARVEFDVPGPGTILFLALADDSTEIGMTVDVNKGANTVKSNGTAYMRFVTGPVAGALNAAGVVTSKREGLGVHVRVFYAPAKAPPVK